MKFKIENEVFDKFPTLLIAIPVIIGFDNTKSKSEALEILRDEEEKLRRRSSWESFVKDPRVSSYYDAFRTFGVDPEKKLPAHVALAKRVLEGGSLPDINPMVNFYNAMSIKYTTPFGGENLASLYGDFVLKLAKGGEKWTAIGGKETKKMSKGDLVWGDDLDISTPSLNWRQCDRTKLTGSSKDGFFIMDGFSDVNRDVIEKASKEFIEKTHSMFGGKAQIYLLDKDNPEVEVQYQTKDVGEIESSTFKGETLQGRQYIGISKEIVSAIREVAGKAVDVKLDVPENSEFGDYSTNVAMQLAGKGQKEKGESKINKLNNEKNKVKKSSPITGLHTPHEIALEIVNKLKTNKKLSNVVEQISVAGPGFINFYLKKEVLLEALNKINSLKDFENYATLINKKIAVEYTDPNPFKEFHIGHLYSNLIGESISRILEANSAKVWRGDFYGDVGMHVAKSVWGMLQKMENENVTLDDMEKMTIKERQNFMGQGYAMGTIKYEEDGDIKEQIKDINYMIYVASQEILEKEKNWKPLINYKKFIEANTGLYEKIKPVYQKGLKWSLEYFETYYRRLGTKFDGYYPESWVGEYGVQMVEDGLKKGILEKSDGAVVFKGERFGLHTRVFLNKMGLPTYEAKDLGLAKAKYQDFEYDKSINIFGKEIDEYYYVVKKAMQLIDPGLGEKASHIAHGMVNLPEGKMSSRKGNVITVEWLLNEARDRSLKLIDNPEMDEKEKFEVAEKVGQAAVKYALLKNNIGNDVTFDFGQSITFDGNSGPYLQYTYARTQSVLAKLQNTKNKEYNSTFKGETSQGNADLALNGEELSLLRAFVHYPEVVAEAAEKYAPNLICNYLFNLAQKFNTFYNAHKILVEDSFELELRLNLTNATGIILKHGLRLLGIKAPERM